MAIEGLPAVPAAPDLSAATNGDETRFYLDVGDGWKEVAELDPEDGLSDLPSGTQEMYETTHMKSGDFKEWKKNRRRDGVETDITGNYVIGSDSDALLVAAEDASGSVPYCIELREGGKVEYGTGHALFHSLRRSNPGTSVRKFTITAKWVTPMVLTQAAPEDAGA